jgi:ABC-type microcin C transport system permease subunit YejB
VDVGGRTVTAVAPCPEDVIVSKLARLDDKDKAFIEAYHAARPLDPRVIEERIRSSNFEAPIADRAFAYIRNLIQFGAPGGEPPGGPG